MLSLLAFAYLPFYKNAIRRIRLQIGFANLPLYPLTSYLSFMHGPEPPACSLGTLFIPVGFIFLIAATVFQGQ